MISRDACYHHKSVTGVTNLYKTFMITVWFFKHKMKKK